MSKLTNDERVTLKRMTYYNDLNGMIAVLAKAILKMDEQS
jgi:hypothetical protein